MSCSWGWLINSRSGFQMWVSLCPFSVHSNLRKQFLLSPSSVPAELLIKFRDHIPIIATWFSGSLKNVQALYGQFRHTESLPRQMLFIAALRNLKNLAGYCLGKLPAWTPKISIISIIASSLKTYSLPVSFSSLKAWKLTLKWSIWAIY